MYIYTCIYITLTTFFAVEGLLRVCGDRLWAPFLCCLCGRCGRCAFPFRVPLLLTLLDMLADAAACARALVPTRTLAHAHVGTRGLPDTKGQSVCGVHPRSHGYFCVLTISCPCSYWQQTLPDGEDDDSDQSRRTQLAI